jgi:hypothetical protein
LIIIARPMGSSGGDENLSARSCVHAGTITTVMILQNENRRRISKAGHFLTFYPPCPKSFEDVYERP